MRDATDITIILDRSGSMSSIKTDTIGGVNQFVSEQQKVAGECRLTLTQFDTQDPQEIVADAVLIADFKPLTDSTFLPRGGTPLYDAVGLAIVRTGERLSKISEADRPNKVIFVIVTDGEENSSREYTRSQVFDMVKVQTDQFNWQFAYIGTNHDALKAAASISISAANALAYGAHSRGVGASYAAVSANVAHARSFKGSADANALSFSDEQRKKAADVDTRTKNGTV